MLSFLPFEMLYVLDALNSRTDRLSRALCVCLSITAAVKCTALGYYYNTKLMQTLSFQNRTKHLICGNISVH